MQEGLKQEGGREMVNPVGLAREKEQKTRTTTLGTHVRYNGKKKLEKDLVK